MAASLCVYLTTVVSGQNIVQQCDPVYHEVTPKYFSKEDAGNPLAILSQKLYDGGSTSVGSSLSPGRIQPGFITSSVPFPQFRSPRQTQ
jgi:hypothetical protein